MQEHALNRKYDLFAIENNDSMIMKRNHQNGDKYQAIYDDYGCKKTTFYKNFQSLDVLVKNCLVKQ